MTPEPVLECCQCAKAYNQEHELADNYGTPVKVSIHRTLEHSRAISRVSDDLSDAASVLG